MDRAEKQKVLEEIGGVPEDMYDGLVRDLISQTREKIAEMKKALNEDDYDSIARTAHFVKGSAVNLRLYTIYDMAKGIEQTLAQKKTRDGLAGDLKKLEETLAQLEQEFTE